MVGRITFAYFARNARCTVTNRLTRVIFQHTKRLLPNGAAIFSLHTLASPSSRNVNYDEKQFTGKKRLSFSFFLYRFHKYVSCGFPIINFGNPGVHYETSCIKKHVPEDEGSRFHKSFGTHLPSYLWYPSTKLCGIMSRKTVIKCV